MKWRRRHTVGTAVLLLGAAFYGYFIYRSTEVKDADGWHLRFTYLPFHCRVCMGHVEELSYKGIPLPVPDWRWKTNDGLSTPMVLVHTPVGQYVATDPQRRWRLSHHSLRIEESETRVEAGELFAGWYNARIPQTSGTVYVDGPYMRKQGTPSHWCLIATYDEARWVSPEKVGELDW